MSLKQCTNNKKSTLPFKARLPCLAQNLYTYCERVTTVQTRMSSKQIFSIWLATADQTSLTDIPPGRETARVCTSPFLINRCPCLPFNFQIGQSNSRLTIISITCSTIWGTEVNIVALYKTLFLSFEGRRLQGERNNCQAWSWLRNLACLFLFLWGKYLVIIIASDRKLGGNPGNKAIRWPLHCQVGDW